MVVVALERAREVLSLRSRIRGLATSRDSIDRLLGGADLDPLVSFALWSAAITSYGRAFTLDQRPSFNRDFLDELGLRPQHDRMMELRNQHIAHRDSLYEQDRLMLLLDPGGVTGVIGVANLFATMVGQQHDDLVAHRALIDAVIEHLESLAQRLTTELRVQASAVPAAELYVAAARGWAWKGK